MTAIKRVQNWYLQQCNGDWEHSFGITIETLDNPGWWIKIDLEGTSLENAIFELTEYKSELDWFFIKVKDCKFDASGDPTKLEFLITYFLDEFIPKFEDKAFEYDVLLPLEGITEKVWLTDCKIKKVDAHNFKITFIPEIKNRNILTETFDVIEKMSKNSGELQLNDKIGDLIQTTLVDTFHGIHLAKLTESK